MNFAIRFFLLSKLSLLIRKFYILLLNLILANQWNELITKWHRYWGS